MPTISDEDLLLEKLKDKEGREAFVHANIGVGIAFQVRALRRRYNLKQADLARRMATSQPVISGIENAQPGEGLQTLTLEKIAAAFDVGLIVRFVPFSENVKWAAKTGYDELAVASYPVEFGGELARMESEAAETGMTVKSSIVHPPEVLSLSTIAATTSSQDQPVFVAESGTHYEPRKRRVA